MAIAAPMGFSWLDTDKSGGVQPLTIWKTFLNLSLPSWETKNGHSNFASRVAADQLLVCGQGCRPPSIPSQFDWQDKAQIWEVHYSQSASHTYWIKNKKEFVIPSLCI